MPTPETAGRTTRKQTGIVTFTLNGYTGTLITSDGARPQVGIGAHASGKGGTPMPLQSFDLDQLDAVISVLLKLRAELQFPGHAS